MGYLLTIEGVYNSNPGEKVFVLEYVPGTSQSLPEKEEIIKGIEMLLMEMIGECYDKYDIKTPTIRDAELGETLQNWIVSPSLVRQESW